LAGFVASTYMRGIHFLQIPTSLTAQVDSSVGGKTGVNTAYAKNMVGTFTQPDGVLIDPNCLATLGKRELYEGMGEVIKCGLIADAELWDILQGMTGDVDNLLDNAEALIYHSCDVKRKVVVEDELDNGTRLYLNFGHTIGHAVEATAGYGKVMHGEGVAIGMIQITKVAEDKGLVEAGLTEKIREMVLKFHLPTTFEDWDVVRLAKAITLDKKARGAMVKTVLVPKVGEAFINEIAMADVLEWLK
jgi:3-dehydroquinate synthase